MSRTSWKTLLARTPASGRVLVVDDESEVRNALSRLLTHTGYQVRQAASAEEADQWMSTERFDICLLDIHLPRMPGTEFLTWAMCKDPEMAVIMLTGVDEPQVALACLDQGARTFLVKPVETAFLLRALRDAMAMRTLLLEHNRRAGRVEVLKEAPWPTSS